MADRFIRFIRQFLQDLEKKDSEIEAAAASMSFEQICKQNQSEAQSIWCQGQHREILGMQGPWSGKWHMQNEVFFGRSMETYMMRVVRGIPGANFSTKEMFFSLHFGAKVNEIT